MTTNRPGLPVPGLLIAGNAACFTISLLLALASIWRHWWLPLALSVVAMTIVAVTVVKAWQAGRRVQQAEAELDAALGGLSPRKAP